jgi:hypothetical protein
MVGHTSVDVVDHDVRDVLVTIEPGIDVAGTWRSDDPGGLKNAERGPIVLRPLDGLPEALVPPVIFRDDGPFLFEVSTAGGTFDGIVIDSAGKPVVDASVVLIPPLEFQTDHSAFKATATDARGKFTIKGIRPGVYTTFAILEKLGMSVHLTPYLNYGTKIEIEKKQRVSQNLTLIPKQ